MSINIFLFSVTVLIYQFTHYQGPFWEYDSGMVNNLKMRNLSIRCVNYPAFQSTILQTFFGLTKFFYEIGKI
jgi:hypothetical protein